MDNQKQLNILKSRFEAEIIKWKEQWDELTVVIKAEAVVPICRFLRDEPKLDYKVLSSLTGVDLGIEADPRFEVVYHLYSLSQGHRLRLKVGVNDGDSLPTVTTVWSAADWYERETYDLFGVLFDGHPNLRRVMMPDEYEGHPLRKDFPLRGYTR